MNPFRRCGSGERGAVAVLVALLMVALVGFTAIAIDVGLLYAERRGLQRTADVSALSGVQLIPDGEDVAEATAIDYLEKNPTLNHTGPYDPARGDLVDAKSAASGGCLFQGVGFDCVDVRARVSEFEFFFAPVLGIDKGSVQAHARAVIGNGAPGGEKLVPWILLDCPDTTGERGFSDEIGLAIPSYLSNCPYTFDSNYTTGKVELFLDSQSQTGGNFQGADLADSTKGECPFPTGYFKQGGGGNEYRAFLAGEATPDVIPCVIGPGARLHAKTGGVVGGTVQGLDARGVDSCMDEVSYGKAIEDIGGGFVKIVEANPCIVALIMVVKADPDHPDLKNQVSGDIKAMQSPELEDVDADHFRFARLSKGTSSPLVVRRFAFFYITGRAPYQGLFLQAVDPESELAGPLDPASGVFKIRLIPFE